MENLNCCSATICKIEEAEEAKEAEVDIEEEEYLSDI